MNVKQRVSILRFSAICAGVCAQFAHAEPLQNPKAGHWHSQVYAVRTVTAGVEGSQVVFAKRPQNEDDLVCTKTNSPVTYIQSIHTYGFEFLNWSGESAYGIVLSLNSHATFGKIIGVETLDVEQPGMMPAGESPAADRPRVQSVEISPDGLMAKVLFDRPWRNVDLLNGSNPAGCSLTSAEQSISGLCLKCLLPDDPTATCETGAVEKIDNLGNAAYLKIRVRHNIVAETYKQKSYVRSAFNYRLAAANGADYGILTSHGVNPYTAGAFSLTVHNYYQSPKLLGLPGRATTDSLEWSGQTSSRGDQTTLCILNATKLQHSCGESVRIGKLNMTREEASRWAFMPNDFVGPDAQIRDHRYSHSRVNSELSDRNGRIFYEFKEMAGTYISHFIAGSRIYGAGNAPPSNAFNRNDALLADCSACEGLQCPGRMPHVPAVQLHGNGSAGVLKADSGADVELSLEALSANDEPVGGEGRQMECKLESESGQLLGQFPTHAKGQKAKGTVQVKATPGLAKYFLDCENSEGRVRAEVTIDGQ